MVIGRSSSNAAWVMFLATWAQSSAVAQERVSTRRTAASVPFVGCTSDGQVGPIGAPEGTSPSLSSLTSEAAHELAYYKSAQTIGVLAPRGWYCLGVYGSGGDALLLSHEPIGGATVFLPGRGFVGPAIVISHSLGYSSGRFDVAEIIARVFPAYKAFAVGVMEGFGAKLTFGPYASDALMYKNKMTVEYRTPGQVEGLGTHSLLKKNGAPIEGVAMLLGQAPDLLLLAVRLPPELASLLPLSFARLSVTRSAVLPTEIHLHTSVDAARLEGAPQFTRAY